MLFNSLEFLWFFVLVTVAVYLTPQRLRWALLLGASYYFYACWEPLYLVLIVGSTLVTYGLALAMGGIDSEAPRKALLWVALTTNLGVLFCFKYLDFVNDSLRALLSGFGVTYGPPGLGLLLPVGISFYTFQALSYSIDVYRGARPVERHLGRYALYVAFFPQLVAGPIERSTRLLPQLAARVTFDPERITSGLALMLLGFFKKLVVADRLALYVDAVYGDPSAHSGPQVVLATYLFAFQIYCDFSGYSDIAVGAARVLGYDLSLNFDRPYAARSIAEFWRRWHITLSTWFRDYLYIPLGGNRSTMPRWIFNIAVVFLLSGLWHGASWTFVVWGALHGTYMVVAVLAAPAKSRLLEMTRLGRAPRLLAALETIFVFNIVALAWVFFRARTMGDAWNVLTRVTTGWRWPGASTFGELTVESFGTYELTVALGSIAALELVQRIEKKRGGFLSGSPLPLRWPAYLLALSAILVLGNFDVVEFVYFQF